jgi:hypothetical protein
MLMVAVHKDGHVERAKGSKVLATKCWRYRGKGRLVWRRGDVQKFGTAWPSFVWEKGMVVLRFYSTWDVIEAAGFRVQSPDQNELPF